jgi:L-threonylcarbamoyladenylate synthase
LNQLRIPAKTTAMSTITSETITNAAFILRAGGVAIIPTDTVYGIAAHPDSSSAVARICTIKGRPTGKPIALLAADKESVLKFCSDVPAKAQKLMDAFWPGALTLVLPCGNEFEGFRVPDHDQTRELLKACEGTLRVTSANLSGAMPAKSAVEALKDVGLEADLVINGGTSPGGVASTVVKVDADNTLTILREGAITSEQIHSIL